MSNPRIDYAKIALWAVNARRTGLHQAQARWLLALMEGREPYWAPDR